MRRASTVAAWMAARNAVLLAPSQPPRVSTSTLGIVSLRLVDRAHAAHAPRPGNNSAAEPQTHRSHRSAPATVLARSICSRALLTGLCQGGFRVAEAPCISGRSMQSKDAVHPAVRVGGAAALNVD